MRFTGACGGGLVAAGRQGEQRVHGNVEEHRASAGSCGQGEGVGDRRCDVLDGAHCPGGLGDAGQDGWVVELLEGSAAPPVRRSPSADHDQGSVVEVGPGQGTHDVRDARPGGHSGESRCAGEPPDPLSREDCGLLMPHVDQRQWAGHTIDHGLPATNGSVIEREDMRAAEREQGPRTCALCCLDRVQATVHRCLGRILGTRFSRCSRSLDVDAALCRRHARTVTGMRACGT